MRDIRFRAYIKDINDIVPVKNIDFYKELVQVDAELPYDGVLKLNEVELMQYTGLKDKNGIEVYEGDILQLFYGKQNTPLTTAKVFLIKKGIGIQRIYQNSTHSERAMEALINARL